MGLGMRFHIVALLFLPIFRRSHSLGFERSVSDTVGSVGFQVESDSLTDDSLVQLSPHDQESHFITAPGDHDIFSNRGNGVDGCQVTAKKNSKGRKSGGVSCPAVYDIQQVKVEECTPAKKLCPIFLEPLCCTGNKRNIGYPFAFDVESCISYNEWDNCRLDVCKLFENVFCCQQLGMVLMDPDGGFGCTYNFL